jgi:hypothetical protein
MAEWFMRWQQYLLCEGSALSRVAIAIGAARARTPTNDRRDNVSRTRERAHAPNYGGAIV